MKVLVLVTLAVILAAPFSEGRSTGVREPTFAGCMINLNKDLPKKNEPLLLVRGEDNELTLAMPEAQGKEGTISLRKGEELVIACPGNKNQLIATSEDVTSGACELDAIVAIGNKKIKISDLDCKNRVAASLNPTNKPCAGGKGVIVEIGFEIGKWHKLAEVCHNVEDSLTYYAVHTLYGSSVAGKVIQSFRPGFSRGEKMFFKGFNPESSYNQNNQDEVFNTLFGAKLTSQYLDSKKFFLARGHLAPDADFLFGPWQLATYFYVNAAPQWQAINAGHWLSVENNVRKIASSLGADLDVATGTYGILVLPDSKGKLQEVYLENKRLPAPELYWKVLHNPQDDSCIALVSTNNPYLQSNPKPICKDVCSKYGWPELQSDLSKGYVYCCEYKDLKEAVIDVPDFKCKSGLSFQK